MKKVKKEIFVNCETKNYSPFDCIAPYTYEVSSDRDIDFNSSIFIEIEEPESIKEFLEVNKLSKKKLLKWLIKNYKL